MNTNKNIYITPEEYEKMQSTFNCKTEYDNGRIREYISGLWKEE